MQLQFSALTFAFLSLARHNAFAAECQNTNLGYGFSEATHDATLGDTHWGQGEEQMCYPKVHSNGSGSSGVDDSVAVLVGGNFSGAKGAEIEGNMVVMGDFHVDQNGPLNFVSAGEGTQINPNKGGDCITVGGDMSSAKRLEVFYPHYQCRAVVKGQSKNSNTIAPNWMTGMGFKYESDPNLDMTKYEEQVDSLRAKSLYWGSLPTTIGAQTDVLSQAFNIRCTNDDAIQVFNVPASSLEGNGYHSYVFNENCSDKTILVNVQGTGSIKFTTKHMKWMKDGTIQSGGWANFPSCMNSSILWNFPNARDAVINGSDELQGSVLVNGNLEMQNSGQSGRTMVLGDFKQNAWGSELHSFDFNPPQPLPGPNCVEVPTVEEPTDTPIKTRDPRPTNPPVHPPVEEGEELDCVGEIIETSKVTSLDFFHSVVSKNELHLDGGELRYSDIGIVRDRAVDLVVTVAKGDYTDIADVWEERNKTPDEQNGKHDGSQFANINLQTVEGKPKSGEGNFQFCFHDKKTNDIVKVDTFRWSVFDLDQRGGGIEERMFMDLAQSQSMQVWPNAEESEIDMMCEDGSALPCKAGIRTLFHSTTAGVGSDNPTDPNNMDTLQKKRSITFTFTDTDCWEFTYDHYCPGEQDDGDGSICKGYTGGNFLFSGDSTAIHTEGECILPPPPAPTTAPTNSPTNAPTNTPTAAPSKSPTNSPTSDPTANPTVAPTNAPTMPPTNNPTAEPTNPPTDEPTKGPTDAPTTEPTKSPTAEPTKEPIDASTAAPTTSSPTLSPTIQATTRPPISTNSGKDNDDDMIFRPACPEDITIVRTSGVTDFPIDINAAEIVRQAGTTVTVGLNQQWTSSLSQSVDAIFYRYKESIWSNKCYKETNVKGGVLFDTVTIQCNIMSPYAFLEICVVDDDVLSASDNATVPKCCHSEENVPPNTPTVCYSLEIRCETLCVEPKDDRMLLRGTSRN